MIAKKSNQELFKKEDPLSLLTNADSMIIEKVELMAHRTEQTFSNYDCTKSATVFDKNDKIVLIRTAYHCNSDTRTTWTNEVYFDQGQKVLEISFDAFLKVIYVERKENAST